MNHRIFHRIVCLTRETEIKRDPRDLLDVIKKASESPLSVIKEITKSGEIKRTLKVHVLPWGDMCLHEYRWDSRRIAVSPFRLSRGERAWYFYEEMRRNNISVPEPLVLIEVRKLIFTTNTYVATRWIHESVRLDSIVLHEDLRARHDLGSILACAVDAVAKLHDAGFVHGDLKWSNILFVGGSVPHVVLTDLDALKKSASTAAQGRDFARFLIAPGNCSLSEAATEILIERYLTRRAVSRSLLEKTLRRHVANRPLRHRDDVSYLHVQ